MMTNKIDNEMKNGNITAGMSNYKFDGVSRGNSIARSMPQIPFNEG
jgi:hypothetical protein